MAEDLVLKVDELSVSFLKENESISAVRDVSFSLRKGQKLGVVGESGSGKSVTSLTILNLLTGHTTARGSGEILFTDSEKQLNLTDLSDNEIRKIRGNRISMVFQEPMSSLNPVIRCGKQVKEILDIHNILEPEKRKQYILDLFEELALPDVERIYRSFPHELSGGQLQRVNIAMALAPRPDIIICDEPTTALDVTVQAQILDLLDATVRKYGIALIFISHDLDVIARLCDSVIVMYQGQVVESGPLPITFQDPKHSYTQALLTCKPTADNRNFVLPTVSSIMDHSYVAAKRKGRSYEDSPIVLETKNLSVHFTSRKGLFFGKSQKVKAVNTVTLQLLRNECLGVVGESGSGKSTMAYCLSGLIEQTAGEIFYKGKLLTHDLFSTDTQLRTDIQLIFQDPYGSLNPRMSVGESIEEPIQYHKIVPQSQVRSKMLELLEQVGLNSNFASRYPHQLSGGQRQRVCIARALSVNPKILICDESVSALDVSVQAQILNLLDQLKSQLDLSMIFISHDLAVVHYICDRVIVLKDGVVVEENSAEKIMHHPVHPYTQNLINSIPARE